MAASRRSMSTAPSAKTRASSVLAGLALGIATMLWLPAQAATPIDLQQLMLALARTKGGDATFVERRQVQMLDRTLMSSGRLSFEAPDTFVRETLKPVRERLAVAGNELTMTRSGRSRTLALDAVPEAAVIVEAIRGTLTGNRGALERLFETSVSGSAESWSLALVPRDMRLRGQVASVRVSGSAGIVREVQVLIADGDRSVMTIEPFSAEAAGARASGAASVPSASASTSASASASPKAPARSASEPG